MSDVTLAAPNRSRMDRMLDGIEKAGNKVPHPVLMFLYLIIFVIVLSVVLAAFDVSVTEEVAVSGPSEAIAQVENELGGSVVVYDPETFYEIEVPEYVIQEQTFEVNSLLAIDGLRFMFSSFVNNFAGFGVVAVTFVAMMGVGVAEHAGMMGALIRKLVAAAPPALLGFFIIFVGVLSSVASDAGYLILIPLAAAAFASVGRHPLVGLAAAFAGVGAIFAVNVIITPVDSMVTELTNDVLPAGTEPLTVTANFYFSVVSSIVMAIVAVIVTQRMVAPRLGAYDPADGDPAWQAGSAALDADGEAAEARGLRLALYGLIAMVLMIVLLVAPPGAPLREPGTGDIIGNTPFMQSLIFLITLIFLVCGICYGIGAGTVTSSNDVITGVTKTFAGLSGLIFMLLMISQFIAFFNYTNIPRVTAVELAHLLERAGWGALPLLIGFIVVIILLDIIIPGVVPKWAIFAPVFIPIFLRLGVAPQTVLAAYRIGDSPMNVVTPLMVYLPFVVTVAQRYQKKAGIGTIIALMLPYVVVVSITWIALFVIWWLLGLPVGPGFPIEL